MKARTGKIARLPKSIRDELNRRLADGVPGDTLLNWLHEQPGVAEVLEREFDGRPILKQNLSEWRQGGFKDWEARMERIESIQRFTEEAEDLNQDAPGLPDRLAAILSGRLASALAATPATLDGNKPRALSRLLALGEAVATIRRFDQGASRLQLEREQLEMKKAGLQLAREAQTQRTHEQWRQWTHDFMTDLLSNSQSAEETTRRMFHLLYGHADEKLINEESRRNREKAGLPPYPEDATLVEKAEHLMKMHRLAEDLRKAAKQEQSN